MKKLFPILLALCSLLPAFASAHQPRVVEGHQTAVVDPEISKAYYGQLSLVPDVYTITATTSFNLYVNVLVPDIAGQKKDVSATITKDGRMVAVLDGTTYAWKSMFEPFGYDTYWQGPEYKAKVDAGTYTITVSSANNDSKYSLAVGETESFDLKETLNALTLVPQLKKSFFNESPASFILSPFGWGLILTLYVLAGAVGFAYRYVLQQLAKGTVRSVGQNISTMDRVLRLAIGLVLLVWAITTSWSLILIFFSGFAVFEALFSWCGLYAAMGKNTCPA